jgi:hypothetical protein
VYGFREVSSGHLPYFSLNMNSGMDIESGTATLSNGQRSVVPSQARESSSPLTKRELRHPSGRCENHCSGVSPTRAANRSCGCQCAQLVSARDRDIVNMGASTTDTAGSESRRNGGRDAKSGRDRASDLGYPDKVSYWIVLGRHRTIDSAGLAGDRIRPAHYLRGV